MAHMKFLLFKSTNCGACKMITPVVKQIQEENNLDLTELFVDEESGRDQAISYGIGAVPTIIKIDDGIITKLVGYRPKKDLEEFLL
jgi:thioredoxin 1